MAPSQLRGGRGSNLVAFTARSTSYVRRGGGRQRALPVLSFAVSRALGLSRPTWLPDFGLAKRKAVLDRFFSAPSREGYEELLDDGFRMSQQLREEAGHSRRHGKADFIEVMCGSVAPAIPDFTWSAATDGEADKDGFAIVVVQASGHHTGAPFSLPGLPPVPPSGRRVVLGEEVMKVRVEGGRIREIQVLPSEGAGPLALYKALGGEVPPGVPLPYAGSQDS